MTMNVPKVPDEEKDWDSIDIFIFSNGQQCSPPRKYHLESNELKMWDETLSHLAELQYGLNTKIELYTIEGKKVNGPLELVDAAAYVAVISPDPFIQAGYSIYLIKASRSWEKRNRESFLNNVPVKDNFENQSEINHNKNKIDDYALAKRNALQNGKSRNNSETKNNLLNKNKKFKTKMQGNTNLSRNTSKGKNLEQNKKIKDKRLSTFTELENSKFTPQKISNVQNFKRRGKNDKETRKIISDELSIKLINNNIQMNKEKIALQEISTPDISNNQDLINKGNINNMHQNTILEENQKFSQYERTDSKELLEKTTAFNIEKEDAKTIDQNILVNRDNMFNLKLNMEIKEHNINLIDKGDTLNKLTFLGEKASQVNIDLFITGVFHKDNKENPQVILIQFTSDKSQAEKTTKQSEEKNIRENQNATKYLFPGKVNYNQIYSCDCDPEKLQIKNTANHRPVIISPDVTTTDPFTDKTQYHQAFEAMPPVETDKIVENDFNGTGATFKYTSDKYSQTEWCNTLLEVRCEPDGHYSFHLPPLNVVKKFYQPMYE